MRSSERGATAIIVAIVLTVLCGFVALSLDVGHLFSVRGELQNGADAAALAGAKRLNGTNKHSELSIARTDAENYARNHPTDVYDVEPQHIELGAVVTNACPPGTAATTPLESGYNFCAIPGLTEEDAANINAVRVVTSRTGAPGGTGGGNVPLAFGSFVGKSEQEVRAEAIATLSGPCTEGCPELPIVLRAECLYSGGKLRCDSDGIGPVYYVGLNPAPADTAGLTPFFEKSICDVLTRDDDTCDKPVPSGETIEIKNGEKWESACHYGCSPKTYNQNLTFEQGSTKNDTICERIRWKADRDCDGSVDLGPDGKPAFRAKVPVVQYADAPATCTPGSQYNQQAPIVGWATAAVVSVRCEAIGTSPNQLPLNQEPITALCDATTNFSGSTCVAIQLYCNEEDDETGGVCRLFGTTAPQPVLVR